MKTKTLGFIGGGRVTRIILQAFKNKNADFKNVMVYDVNSDTLNKLAGQYSFVTKAESANTAAKQDVVFIALHPPVIAETLEKIKNEINPDAIVISLAPKITIEKITALTGVKLAARLIPNATSYINEGYNPVCFSPAFQAKGKEDVLSMLKLLGNTFEVAEPKLEAYAIISAMLPTYFWFQWKELQEIGQQTGLDNNETDEAIKNSLIASINLMFNPGLTPEQVMDLIPVKPIGDAEEMIRTIYRDKLLPLFEKIKP